MTISKKHAQAVVEKIFAAWAAKDAAAYMACWHAEAQRDMGRGLEGWKQIQAHFLEACRRFTRIRVDGVVFEEVTPTRNQAVVRAL